MEARNDRWTLLQRALYADISTWLVDSILAKVDRATMAAGLEARSPLLDFRLMEFAFATLLADEKRNAAKVPLRRFADSLLGAEFASVKKEGFQTPFAGWFAGPLRAYIREHLATLQANLPGVFDEHMVWQIEAEHGSGRRNHELKLWSLVALAEWSTSFKDLRLPEGH
jgi:asparagine synthase (glutamine-hydrolysing)